MLVVIYLQINRALARGLFRELSCLKFCQVTFLTHSSDIDFAPIRIVLSKGRISDTPSVKYLIATAYYTIPWVHDSCYTTIHHNICLKMQCHFNHSFCTILILSVERSHSSLKFQPCLSPDKLFDS